MRLRSAVSSADSDFTFVATVADALGHPSRVGIVKYVAQKNTVRNDVCNKDLVENLPSSQATVSQHVKKLLEAEVLTVRKENGFSFYTVNRETLVRYVSLIQSELMGD